MEGDENSNRDKLIEDHVLCAIFGWLECRAKEDVKKLVILVFKYDKVKKAMLSFVILIK